MTKRLFSISVIVFITVVFSGVTAQSKTDDKENARVFVQKFYDWYSVLVSATLEKRAKTPPDIVAIKARGYYFDIPLRKALIDDANAQAKVAGEIVGLDFDPFSNAQDTRVGYQTGNVKQLGNTFLVDVHDIEKGKSEKAILAAELVVVAKVVKVNGHWVFTNFIYPSKGGSNDLLSTLRVLRKDRKKTTK
jgi:hypothetical protein